MTIKLFLKSMLLVGLIFGSTTIAYATNKSTPKISEKTDVGNSDVPTPTCTPTGGMVPSETPTAGATATPTPTPTQAIVLPQAAPATGR